jgi:hypothetical protein
MRLAGQTDAADVNEPGGCKTSIFNQTARPA